MGIMCEKHPEFQEKPGPPPPGPDPRPGPRPTPGPRPQVLPVPWGDPIGWFMGWAFPDHRENEQKDLPPDTRGDYTYLEDNDRRERQQPQPGFFDGMGNLIDDTFNFFENFSSYLDGLNDFSQQLNLNAGYMPLPWGTQIQFLELGLGMYDLWTKYDEQERIIQELDRYGTDPSQYMRLQGLYNRYTYLQDYLDQRTPDLSGLDQYWVRFPSNLIPSIPYNFPDCAIGIGSWLQEEFKSYEPIWLDPTKDYPVINQPLQAIGEFITQGFLGLPAFFGQVPYAAEWGMRHFDPTTIQQGVTWALVQQGRYTYQEFQKNPARAIGGILGMVYGPKVLKGAFSLSPLKYGKFAFETGSKVTAPKYLGLFGPMTEKPGFVKWRGLYYESPGAIASRILTGIPDYRANKFIAGYTTIPRSHGFSLMREPLSVFTDVRKGMGYGFDTLSRSKIMQSYSPYYTKSYVSPSHLETAEYMYRSSQMPGIELSRIPSFDSPNTPLKTAGIEGAFYHGTNRNFISQIIREGELTVGINTREPGMGMFTAHRPDLAYPQYADGAFLAVYGEVIAPSRLVYEVAGIRDLSPGAKLQALNEIYSQYAPTNAIMVGGKPLSGWRWEGKLEGEANISPGSVLYPHTSALNKILNMFVETDRGLRYTISPGGVGQMYRILDVSFMPDRSVLKYLPHDVLGKGSRILDEYSTVGNPLQGGKLTVGLPRDLAPYVDYSYFMPNRVNAPLSVPLMRDILVREGAPGSLQLFDTYHEVFKEFHILHPKMIRDPVAYMEEIPFLREGSAEDLIRDIRGASQDHLIFGNLSQNLQARFIKNVADVDLFTTNPESTAAAFKSYIDLPGDRIRVKDGKIEIFYPESQKWAHALDTQKLEGGIDTGGYGLPSGPHFTAGGLRWVGLQEQMLRKALSSAYLRRTGEGRVISPKMHRGKDIADTLIGIQEARLYWQESKLPAFMKEGHLSKLVDIEKMIYDVQLRPGYLPGSEPVTLSWGAVREIEQEINFMRTSPARGLLQYDIQVLEVQKSNFIEMLNKKEGYLGELHGMRERAVSMRDTHLKKLYTHREKISGKGNYPGKAADLADINQRIAYMKDTWTAKHIDTIDAKIQEGQKLWENQNLLIRNPVEDALNRIGGYEYQPIEGGYRKVPLMQRYVPGDMFPTLPGFSGVIPGLIRGGGEWWAEKSTARDQAMFSFFPEGRGRRSEGFILGEDPGYHYQLRSDQIPYTLPGYLGGYHIPAGLIPYTLPGYLGGYNILPGPHGYEIPVGPTPYNIPPGPHGYEIPVGPTPYNILPGPHGYEIPVGPTPYNILPGPHGYEIPIGLTPYNILPGPHGYEIPIGPTPYNIPPGPHGYEIPVGPTPYNIPPGPHVYNIPVGPTPYNIPPGPHGYNIPVGPTPYNIPAGPHGYEIPIGPTPYNIPAGPHGYEIPIGPTPYNIPPGPHGYEIPVGPTPYNIPPGPHGYNILVGPTPYNILPGPHGYNIPVGPTPYNIPVGPHGYEIPKIPYQMKGKTTITNRTIPVPGITPPRPTPPTPPSPRLPSPLTPPVPPGITPPSPPEIKLFTPPWEKQEELPPWPHFHVRVNPFKVYNPVPNFDSIFKGIGSIYEPKKMKKQKRRKRTTLIVGPIPPLYNNELF